MYFQIFSENNHNISNRINNYCTISKKLFQTHYEVLHLQRNCTTKDIKDAFIRLSKQHHPDIANTTNSATSQKDFIKILEAYNVLSKPDLRRNYDLGLRNNVRSPNPNIYYEHVSQSRDPLLWEHRDKSQDKYYADKPYYGIKGVKRISNSAIVIACVLFTAIGVSLQMIAIRKSVTFKREQMLMRSMETEEVLTGVKRDAVKYGNRIQLQRLKERMEQNNLIQKKDVGSKE